MIQVEPVKKISISAEITRQLLAKILGGEIKAGEKLPPERDLAQQFNTNRNTLREAIRNLQTLGVVEARQGDGLNVLDYRKSGEINLLPLFVQYSGDLAERISVLRDVLNLRRVLLAEVCGLLAATASDAQIDEILGLVESQRGNRGDPERLMQADLDLSMAMVAASGSLAYRWVFNTMVLLYREVAFQFPTLWIFTDDYEDSLGEVLRAARARDGARAKVLMEAHLLKSDALIIQAIDVLNGTL
jgi:DNA-binding FadR family transcriptional regulator